MHFDENVFWALSHHADNGTHFKSGKMFYYWSRRKMDVAFLYMVWVKFGCPGHGKGPWDGFGAVIKQRTSRDCKNDTFVSSSGKKISSIDVAENLESHFCSEKYERDHRIMISAPSLLMPMHTSFGSTLR